MATKKPVHRVTLQLTAGAALVMDLGKMLGQTGVNVVEVKRRYDEASASQRGEIVPVEVTVFDDRSFALRLRTPPTAHLIRRAIDGAGSARPGHEEAGVLSLAALRQIAQRKLEDLNTQDVEAAMRTVAGTARSMGVRTETTAPQ